jgi:hypothetical protein
MAVFPVYHGLGATLYDIFWHACYFGWLFKSGELAGNFGCDGIRYKKLTTIR